MRLWSTGIRTLRCSRQISFPACRRSHSNGPPLESVTVPCQSNGSITLDLHHGANTATARNSSSSVLIYLPRDPSKQHVEQDASNVALLRSNLACPIVQINYRLSEQHKYPTPVHDMLCGFDWIVENLLLRRAITRAGRAESVGQVAVCGEHIGGGLATALALTECRIGQPGIVAAAVSNPVADWVSIDQAHTGKAGLLAYKKSRQEENRTQMELEKLRQLRTRLFRKPEDYFDPFASPILFFRSAGAEVPPPPPDIPVDDLEQLSLLQREEHYRQELETTVDQADTGSKADDSRNPALRKASRRFPSKALGLRLPQFNISTGSASPLRDQAEELTHVLRQSFVRQSKYSAPGHSEFGRKVLMEDEVDELDEDQRRQAAEAERKVELLVHDGSGGWSDGDHGKARLREVAMWLRESLNSGGNAMID